MDGADHLLHSWPPRNKGALKQFKTGLPWWLTPASQPLGRQRWVELQFKASPGKKLLRAAPPTHLNQEGEHGSVCLYFQLLKR
jgi:hypothetical protein